jgi:hypothetical protein
MIPRTYPSTFALNGQQQMVVYFLTSVAGLQRWVDYIPVKLTQGGVENSYNNNGYINVAVLPSLSSQTQAWKEYIPVYQDDVATDAWQVNSIGYIPYNYAQFGDASLMLDFTNGGSIDPRVTFTRASNATVTGPDGVLQYAPHNLLTFSEQFDNAGWSKTRATITANSTAAPDGTITADKFVETAEAGSKIISQSVSASAGLAYSMSVYAKAGERQFIQILLPSAVFGSDLYCGCNLLTGETVAPAGATATATSVGNGWYRFTAAATATVTASGSFQARIANALSSAFNGYTGDGTSGIFIWGAQLNVGALQPYYPTTRKNLLGFTQEFDNAAWTKSNSFVQTNLVTWSEDFDNAAWNKSGATITANSIAAPNGTTTADSLVEDGTTSGHRVANTQSLNSTLTYTTSFYVKENGRTWATVLVDDNSGNGSRAFYNLQTGQIGSVSNSGTGAGGAASITAVGNGWYRCVLTCVPSTVNTGNVRSYISGTTADAVSSYAGTDGLTSIYIWGAQLVQGSTAGDYQRTFGTAAAVQYAAPDGSLTADKLVPNTNNTDHLVSANAGAAVSGTVYTYSVYAKAAGYNFIRLSFGNTAGGGYTFFNLSNGTVGGTSGMLFNEIAAVGDGWYRCVVRRAASSSATIAGDVYVTSANMQFSWAGNGTDGVLIWGAQLSDSASLDPYVYNPVAAPAASAYYGPRFDYDPVTLAPRGLLIEEQRTNLVLRSEEFDNASWTKSNATVTANTIVAPDGSLTADKLVENTANTSHAVIPATGTTYAAAPYTFSFYAKAAERGFVRAIVNDVTPSFFTAYFDLANGTVGSVSGTGAVTSIVAAGNGWYRCSITATVAAGLGNVAIRAATANGTDSYTGDGFSGLYIWGAQLEVGAFPTSYIPTTTAAATRADDVALMQGDNFRNWYRQDEGSFYSEAQVETNRNFSGTFRHVFHATPAGNTNSSVGILINSVSQFQFQVRDAATTTASPTTGSNTGAIFKTAGAYKVDDFAFSVNGNSAITDTSGSAPVSDPPTQMTIGRVRDGNTLGQMNGHIRRIAYFPRRLANAELQAITS